MRLAGTGAVAGRPAAMLFAARMVAAAFCKVADESLFAGAVVVVFGLDSGGDSARGRMDVCRC